VVIASEKFPLTAITFAEVCATSDVPAGVINILTGKTPELVGWMGSHMDVDAVDASGLSSKQLTELKIAGADNLKRIHSFKSVKSPDRILAFVEHKTVWQTIGV